MVSSQRVNNSTKVYGWVIAVSCMMVTTGTYGIFRSSAVLYAECIRVFNVDRQTASWPFAVCGCFNSLSGMLAGLLVSFFTVRQVVLCSTLISALGLGLCYFATDIIWMTICYGVIFGSGMGAGLAIMPIMINEYFVKNRATANGICLAGGPISVFIMAPLSEILIEHYSLRGAFLLLAAFAVQVEVFAALMRPNSKDEVSTDGYISVHPNKSEEILKEVYLERQIDTSNQVYLETTYSIEETECKHPLIQIRHHLKLVITNPMYHVISMNFVACAFTTISLSLVLVDFAEDKGMSRDNAVLLLSIVAIPEILGRTCSGWITDKGYLSRKNGLMFAQVSSGFLLIVTSFVTNDILLAVTLSVFGVFLSSGMVIVNVAYSEYCEEEVVGLALGLKQFGLLLAFAVRPWLIGFFRDATGSYDHLIQSFGVLLILSGSLLIFEPFLKSKLLSSEDSKKQGIVVVNINNEIF